jgi:hypothetical protein
MASPTLSILPTQPGLTQERAAFFLLLRKNSDWKAGNEQNKWALKETIPRLGGSVGGSQLQKAVVSVHRKDPNPSVSATDLATQMTHNLSTANQHYHMDER